MDFVHRPQPLAERIKEAAGGVRQTEVILPQDKSFGGALTWDLSLIVAEKDVGQKFDGRWLTKDGGWTFTFEFGDHGMLKCIAEAAHGETWIMKGLEADLTMDGEIKRFLSFGSVPDAKRKSAASFAFEVDEEAFPSALEAQVVLANGKTEDVVAQRAPTPA